MTPITIEYKVKQLPDDFQVEEITRIATGTGPFAFYRLDKRGWTTPDALAVLRRRWSIEPRRISYAGLKDRHARTVQYFTIFHGPRREMNQQGIHVDYLGQVAEPYTSQDIERNRFRLTVRDLAAAVRLALEEDLPRLAIEGVPNYFDDQRFSSVSGEGGEFIGRLLVRGRFEEALRLALAGPYEHDRAAQKEEKATAGSSLGRLADSPAPQIAARRHPASRRVSARPANRFPRALASLRPERALLTCPPTRAISGIVCWRRGYGGTVQRSGCVR